MWTLLGTPLAVTVAAFGPRLLASTDGDPLVSLTQYGPLGLMVLGFLTGWIVPGPTAKQKDVEIVRLQTLFEQEVLPMTKTYAETMRETARVLDKVMPVLDKAISLLKGVEP